MTDGDDPGVGDPQPSAPPPPVGWTPPPSAGYPAQGYGYPPPYQQPSTNGMAIASMVLGILWLYWIGSILALIFGYVAKRQIDESGGRQQGRGMAIAGIALGWVGVGFLALFLVLGATLFAFR